MDFIWNFLVFGAILFGLSNVLPGVKCRSYLHAVKVAALYSVIAFVVTRVLVAVGFIPAVMVTMLLTAIFPPLLFLAVPMAILVTVVVTGSISLYAADKLVDGFEIASFGDTVLVVLAAGLVRAVLAAVLKM